MNNPTISRLRHDIDSGRTGDKIPVEDPAAAPLGTDEEAAGTPVPPGAGTPGEVRSPPAAIGADTRAMLESAGYSVDEIAALSGAGVV